MQKADHSGHRSRMKKKLMQSGFDHMEPHEVLEILLYYAIPQRNTNDIAKNLIDRFGSISAVFDASVDMLKSAGLTEHQALYLTMFPDIARIYLVDKYENQDKIIDYDNITGFIRDRFIGLEEQENVLLILIDKKGKLVYSGIISQGDFNSASISIREIVTLAINYAATSAFIAHSHPSGLALPSKEDVLVTRDLKKALKLVGIHLLDHFIVADHECVSLAESGLI
nr:JAB domain-containing protein [uncultured Ruminococcus sp.]